jgi:serine/threonine protein kinase
MSPVPSDRDREGTPEDTAPAIDSLLRQDAHVGGTVTPSVLPRVGQVIGNKYRIEEQLGHGGMGVIFRATHLLSQKPVAIKWMLRSIADEYAHQRLLREALAAGRIDHPNVVNVYDVSHEGQCAYLVMELLHGETLRSRLDRGPLEIREAIDLLLPAMRGVGAVHRAGVIHRDLKPDNIFLCKGSDGTAREAKVLDFGISAVGGAYAPSHPTLTKDGVILGTPAYMSPEQLESARSIDARADIYAFGVILYEALTGVRPFDAPSYPELILAIAQEQPRPPSELCAELPAELEASVLRAIAKDRDERFSSMEQLVEALAPFSYDGSRVVPAGRAPARARWITAALGGLCALGLAGLSFYWLSDRRHPPTSQHPAPLPTEGLPASPERTGDAPPALAPRSRLAVDALPVLGDDHTEARYLPPPAREPEPSTIVPGALPRTCQEARAAGRASDGPLKIDPDGSGSLRPFEVYCAGMSAGPGSRAREYLTLVHGVARGEAALNVTHFKYGGGPCPCPDLTRHFTRVRFDPSNLTIDPKDGSFATYDRPLDCEIEHRNQCGESTELAWGGAGSCRVAGDTSGSATLDLRGTPFALAPNASFVPAGFGAAGYATIAPDRKTVHLVGGGLCGSLVPEDATIPLVAVR